MRKSSLFVLALGLALATAACRGDDSGDDDTNNPDANTTTTDVTIQEIQNDSMVPGTKVAVRGVVVTAIDSFGGRTGDFWVQEPGGGEYSGVQVFGAPVDQVAALAIGDVVDITGAQKAEFALTSDTSGNTLTELEPEDGGTMTVTKTGATMTVTPSTVDALAIGQMTDFNARHAEWEKWEGVVVTLANVQVFSTPECITSMGNCNDPTYERFDITGDIQVQTALAAMPDPAVDRGDCLSGVTGIVTYFFDYQILPRTTAEIATGGTSCPTENQSSVCGDSIDNDGNGFTDCDDNNCIVGDAACRAVTTITDIQTASTPVTGGVELQDVRVAGVSFNKKNIWVQTNLQAAANEGIYVRGPGVDLDGFAIGSRVNIIGKVVEFNDSTETETLTQIQAISVTAGTTGAGTVLPVTGQAVGSLGETMESVLVQLTNVRITTLGTDPNYIATLTQSGTTFKADDDMYRLKTDDANDCYATIVGVWSYNVFENDWVFLPRVAAGSSNPTTPDGVLAGNQALCN